MGGRIAALTFLTALLLASCGTDEGTSDNGGDTDAGDSISVVAEDFAFTPEVLEVEAAAEVEVGFENADGTAHTFTIDELDVDLEVAGGDTGTVSFTAPEEGSVAFFCRIHPQMEGQIGSSVAPGSDDESEEQTGTDDLYDY